MRLGLEATGDEDTVEVESTASCVSVAPYCRQRASAATRMRTFSIAACRLAAIWTRPRRHSRCRGAAPGRHRGDSHRQGVLARGARSWIRPAAAEDTILRSPIDGAVRERQVRLESTGPQAPPWSRVRHYRSSAAAAVRARTRGCRAAHRDRRSGCASSGTPASTTAASRASARRSTRRTARCRRSGCDQSLRRDPSGPFATGRTLSSTRARWRCSSRTTRS